jgi:Asp-tRNA(Asn)/Glu-tRNA(Gln) amidotransferase A subunit family amidase
MEEIENGLNQSLADVFRVSSPEAKKLKKAENQVKEAKIIIKEITDTYENNISEFDNEIEKFLCIFYSPKELLKQKKRLEKLNDVQKLTSLYNILASRMDSIDQKKIEISHIISGL